MPFHFTCPYCFKKTLVEDKYAGQTGPCATCGKTVTLPTTKELTPASTKRSSSTLYVAGEAKPAVIDSTMMDDSSIVVEKAAGEVKPGSEPPTFSPFTSAGTSAGNTAPPVVMVQVATSNSELESRLRKRKYWIMGGGTISLIALGFVAYNIISILFSSTFVQDLQERRNRALCMNNLSKIARALTSYAATHGTYPPAVVYDDKGKPKHSWRTLILKELGEYALYDQYRFDEPWDSEHNSSLFARCPKVYISPGVGLSGESSYFLIVGGNTLYPNGPLMRPQDIRDGSDRTILVVEAQNPIHEWTKPIDITIGGNSTIKMGGNHTGGFAAATADGTPLWIPDDTPPELIDALISPAGNEPVDPSNFKP
jgi:hypothetical protein